MTKTDWNKQRRQFRERVARQEDGPSKVYSDEEGETLLAVATLNAQEGQFEASDYLMVSLSLGAAGRLLRAGDWGSVSGPMRSGTSAVALPNTRAEGFSPKAKVLGLAIGQDKAQRLLSEVGGLASLEAASQELHNDPLIQSVMQALWREAEIHGQSSAFFDHGLELVLRRLAEVGGEPRVTKKVRPLSERQLQRVFDLIESRISETFKVSEIAEELGRDPRSFTRAFKSATGYAPYEFFTFRRMERAKDLLRTGESIISIAMDVGYANPAKFASAFRKIVGCAPSEWRRQQN